MADDAPEKIWLLDYGHDECTWCADPSPSGEDHSPIEYVRADTIATLRADLDKAVEGLEAIADDEFLDPWAFARSLIKELQT